MTRVSGGVLPLRLEAGLLARIDAAAVEVGLNRSAWIRTLIHSSLDGKEVNARPRAVRDMSLHRVYCGLPGELLKKIEAEAAATNLRRNVFIRRVLHAQLYEGYRFRVLSKRSDEMFGKLTVRLGALQSMVNRVERAVKAIVRDQKYHQLAERADDLLEMNENLTAAFKAVESFTGWVTFEEHRYWRGDLAADDIVRHQAIAGSEVRAREDDDEDFTAGYSEDGAGAGE